MRATCSRVRERMGDYLSGRMEASETERFRAHLWACPACSGVGEAIRELRALAVPLEERVESALPALREGVRRAVQDASERFPERPLLSRAWTTASAAAAAALLLLAFLATSRDRGMGSGPSDEAFRVLLEEEKLVIHWPENGDRLHTVSRSTTPADFSQAKVAVVQGDRWVDSDPQAPGTVYFYLVD